MVRISDSRTCHTAVPDRIIWSVVPKHGENFPILLRFGDRLIYLLTYWRQRVFGEGSRGQNIAQFSAGQLCPQR